MTKEETWIQKKWRPVTAVVYLIICVFDFMIFPVLWAMFCVRNGITVTVWDPLTLKGAGLFHLSFGAILGVSAFTRGQEKITRYNNPTPSYSRYDEPAVEQEPVYQQTRPKYAPPK